MEKELVELIRYIEERSENLRRYSEKLEKALSRFAGIFGEQKWCRLCGYAKHESTEGPCGTEPHEFVPCITIPIDVIDDEPFFTDAMDNEYYLSFHESQLLVAIGASREDISVYKRFYEVPRAALKALVKSGRLMKFLQKVADELERLGKEYSEAAEIAENIVAAIK